MPTRAPSLLTRDDTFLGVCEALGEDFGFNANLLRAGMAVMLLWQPVAVLLFYAGAAVIVFLSRWLAPSPIVWLPDVVETEASEAEDEPMAIAA